MRIFISYSRKDAEFANYLLERLKDDGHDAFIDTEQIWVGEVWKERLKKLISASDAVIFLLTPSSAKSEVCAWEIDFSEFLGKRILPVVGEQTPISLLPGRMQRLHICNLAPACEVGYQELLAALNQDIVRVREQTRLTELAWHWQNSDQVEGALLRGSSLRSAELWAAQRPENQRALSQLLINFIRESAAQDTRDRQNLQRSLQRQYPLAVDKAILEGEYGTALRLTAAGALLSDDVGLELDAETQGPAHMALWRAIAPALLKIPHSVAYVPGRSVGKLTFDTDGDSLFSHGFLESVVGADENSNLPTLWSVKSCQEILSLQQPYTDPALSAMAPSGQLVMRAADQFVELWNTETRSRILRSEYPPNVGSVRAGKFDPTSNFFVTLHEAGVAVISHVTSGHAIGNIDYKDLSLIDLVFSTDGSKIFLDFEHEGIWRYDIKTKDVKKLPECEHVDATGSYLYTFSQASSALVITLWNALDNSLLCHHRLGVENCLDLWIAGRDGTSLLMFEDRIEVWDIFAQCCLLSFERHFVDFPEHLAQQGARFCYASGRLATTQSVGSVALYDVRKGRLIARLKENTEHVSSIAIDEKGRWLAIGCATPYEFRKKFPGNDTKIVTWDIQRLYARSIAEHSQDIPILDAQIAYSGDRCISFACVGEDKDARNFEILDDQGRLTRLPAPHGMICISSDLSLYITRDGSLFRARAPQSDGADLLFGTVPNGEICVNACFDSDFTKVLTCCGEGKLRLWGISEHRLLWCSTGIQKSSAVSFLENGDFISWDEKDRTLQRISASAGFFVQSFDLGAGEVSAVAVEPSNGVFAIGSDKSIRIIDVLQGQERANLETYGEVSKIHFSKCGNAIVASSAGGRGRCVF